MIRTPDGRKMERRINRWKSDRSNHRPFCSEAYQWSDSDWASRSNIAVSPTTAKSWSLTRAPYKDNNIQGNHTKTQDPAANIRCIVSNITFLCDNYKYEECANVISSLHSDVLRLMLPQLQLDNIIDSIPHTVRVLEALYSRLFIADSEHFPVEEAHVGKVVSQLSRWFASLGDSTLRRKHDSSHYMPVCKNVLKIIMYVEPNLKRKIERQYQSLRRCIDGMGSHGLVTTSERRMLKLHDALKNELEKKIHQYKQAIHTLEELSLSQKTVGQRSVNGQSLSSESHQRMMQLSQAEVHQRLYKNKSLLNGVETALASSYLMSYVDDLKERIASDKDVILNFNELQKEDTDLGQNSIVTPVFQKYNSGFAKLYDLLNELSPESSGRHDIRVLDKIDSKRNYQADVSRINDIVVTEEKVTSGKPALYVITGTNRDAGSGSTAVGSDRGSVNDVEISPPISLISSPFPVAGSSQQADLGELQYLRGQVQTLREKLAESRETIQQFQEREKYLRSRLSEQAKKQLEKGSKFEDLSLGENRPTQLIHRYGNLYSQMRLDVFDALDDLPEMEGFDELKGKLLFSVVVLSYRSVQRHLQQLKIQLQKLLHISPNSDVHAALAVDSVAKDLEDAVAVYLRKTVEKCDLKENIKEVCEQVWSTLFDYPGLKNCSVLRQYIKECVHLSWAFCIQNPPLVLHYETNNFNQDFHNRFHSSNPESDEIQSVLWPGILDGENGCCLYKSVVIT